MIESAPTRGHNLAPAVLRKSGSGDLLRASKYCEIVTSTAVIDTRCARSKAGDTGADANAASSACAPMNISIEDWDTLFCAVEERLRRLVTERDAGTSLPMHGLGGAVQGAMLECLTALDQLHAALIQERERAKAHGNSNVGHIRD